MSLKLIFIKDPFIWRPDASGEVGSEIRKDSSQVNPWRKKQKKLSQKELQIL